MRRRAWIGVFVAAPGGAAADRPDHTLAAEHARNLFPGNAGKGGFAMSAARGHDAPWPSSGPMDAIALR